MFTQKEKDYINSQHLLRLGTVSSDGQPDVVPVGFEFDGEKFFVGGMNNTATRKYKNVADGNPQIALAIDDLESVDPWRPRGLKLYGTAEIVERDGYAGQDAYLQITPTVSWSWEVEGPSMVDGEFNPHKTVHQ